jgi:hypothetical protein
MWNLIMKLIRLLEHQRQHSAKTVALMEYADVKTLWHQLFRASFSLVELFDRAFHEVAKSCARTSRRFFCRVVIVVAHRKLQLQPHPP